MQRQSRERQHNDALARSASQYWRYDTLVGQLRNDYRFRRIAAAAALNTHTRVLEIGSGDGEYSRRFSKVCPDIVSMDISFRMLEQSKRGGQDFRLVQAGVENLPFRDGAFDVVVGNAVLHHLNLPDALPEIFRVVASGGHIAFAEPNILNPIVWMERNIPYVRRKTNTSPDETAFFRWQLARDLRSAGFKEVKVLPVDFHYPGLWLNLYQRLSSCLTRLERVPLLREVAGSLLIAARK